MDVQRLTSSNLVLIIHRLMIEDDDDDDNYFGVLVYALEIKLLQNICRKSLLCPLIFVSLQWNTSQPYDLS